MEKIFYSVHGIAKWGRGTSIHVESIPLWNEDSMLANGSSVLATGLQGESINMDRRIRGFTLIELMVTLAVMAIAAAVAVPHLGGFIGQSRARGIASELESTLQYARAEAIARSSSIRICAIKQPASVEGRLECAGAAEGDAWTNGWLVEDVARKDLLRVSQAGGLPSDIRIGAGSRGSFVFVRTGFVGRDGGGVTGGSLIVSRISGGESVAEVCLRVDAPGGRIWRGKAGEACS